MTDESFTQSSEEMNNNYKHKIDNSENKQLSFETFNATSKGNPKAVYNKLLDLAFDDEKDLRNIGITGIYGAGKSSLWKTYQGDEKNPRIKNVITVSVCKYTDTSSDTKNSTVEHDNIIERQIITQIISQIPEEKIPFSKYKIKKNKTPNHIMKQVATTIIGILFLILFFMYNSITTSIKDIYPDYNNLYYYIVWLGLFGFFIIYCCCLLYNLLGHSKIQLSKINLQGTEARFEQGGRDEESVLYRDLKEIVYLLDSYEPSCVIFEDLDRFNKVGIFEKLRELNTILNNYRKCNGKKNIRFIYMIKDSLFNREERTKFFDLLIPVIPVVDSNNSKDFLVEKLNNQNISMSMIRGIALYIDDMRLLKSITNEFIAYKEIVPIEKLELKADKLLAIIILKNIFPKEFDLLQKNRGSIYNLLKNIKNKYKERCIFNIREKIRSYEQDIAILEKDKFAIMASYISTNVFVDGIGNQSWANFLSNWEKEPDITYMIHVSLEDSMPFTYKAFINQYIINSAEIRVKLEEWDCDNDVIIGEINERISNLELEIDELENGTIREYLLTLPKDEIDKIFTELDIVGSEQYYIPLIRYFVLNGLLDETYVHYKSIFYENALGVNDALFLKRLWEEGEESINLKLEHPTEVLAYLEPKDFKRSNIFNIDIIEECIKEIDTYNLHIQTMLRLNRSYTKLIKILPMLNYNRVESLVKKYLSIDAGRKLEILTRLGNTTVQEIICKCIYTMKYDSDEERTRILALFKQYIENLAVLFTQIEDKEAYKLFIDNLKFANVKFQNLVDLKISAEHIKAICEFNGYRHTATNVYFISKTLLEKNIDYGELIDLLYKEEILVNVKDYINTDFDEFIKSYIDKLDEGEELKVPNHVTEKVIRSSLPVDIKLVFVSYNLPTIIEGKE